MKNKWKLTRINQGLQMTRIEGNAIATRPLNLIDKIMNLLPIILFKMEHSNNPKSLYSNRGIG